MQVLIVDLMGTDYEISLESESVSLKDIKEQLLQIYDISSDNLSFLLDRQVIGDEYLFDKNEFDYKNKKIIMIDTRLYDKKSFPSVRGAFYGSMTHFNPAYFEKPGEDNCPIF